MSSTLRQRLAERRAACAHIVTCVETEFQPVAMVTFYPWQAREWTVPWARLDAFSFSNQEESERLELLFPHHQIIAVGENLRKILDDIRQFKVRCLRDLPASHRAKVEPGDVFIGRLEVKPLADLKSRPPTGNPV